MANHSVVLLGINKPTICRTLLRVTDQADDVDIPPRSCRVYTRSCGSGQLYILDTPNWGLTNKPITPTFTRELHRWRQLLPCRTRDELDCFLICVHGGDNSKYLPHILRSGQMVFGKEFLDKAAVLVGFWEKRPNLFGPPADVNSLKRDVSILISRCGGRWTPWLYDYPDQYEDRLEGLIAKIVPHFSCLDGPTETIYIRTEPDLYVTSQSPVGNEPQLPGSQTSPEVPGSNLSAQQPVLGWSGVNGSPCKGLTHIMDALSQTLTDASLESCLYFSQVPGNTQPHKELPSSSKYPHLYPSLPSRSTNIFSLPQRNLGVEFLSQSSHDSGTSESLSSELSQSQTPDTSSSFDSGRTSGENVFFLSEDEHELSEHKARILVKQRRDLEKKEEGSVAGNGNCDRSLSRSMEAKRHEKENPACSKYVEYLVRKILQKRSYHFHINQLLLNTISSSQFIDQSTAVNNVTASNNEAVLIGTSNTVVKDRQSTGLEGETDTQT